jgi:hypothetical protein
MNRLRPLSLALIATVAAAWTLPAWAGDCAAGRTKYVANCSGCHGNAPNAQARLGSNPTVILTQMTDSLAPGYPSMNFLYPGTVNDADIDDISTYLFYYPSACPVSSPILQASPAPVAFGSVTVGATSPPTTVTITNAGSAAASAVTASTPDSTHFPLSVNTCTNVPLAAGASCSFKVAFHPTVAGALSANITVARSGGSITVGVSGIGSAVATPGQLSIPASLSFASQTVSTTSAVSSMTITNIGGTAVSVSSVVSSNPAEFTIATNSCTTVNAGASCSVGVTFKPSVAGARTATITVISNGVGSPQTISASGTGSASASPGQLSMATTLSFASQAVATTSAASSVTITNVGSTAVAMSGVVSSNPAEFTIASSTCATVNPGATCSIGVTFKPSVIGARNGSISLVSNGVGSPQAISASGTGTTAGSSPTVPVVEYYNAVLDHYFITPVSAEVGLLDTKTPPFQDWSRTGYQFNGYANATAPAGSVAICRFFNSTFAPKSSHFYAPHGLGCEATIASFPDWKLEDDNGGKGGAPHHRFGTSLAERQTMIDKGYVPEGNGIGVGMCAPQ